MQMNNQINWDKAVEDSDLGKQPRLDNSSVSYKYKLTLQSFSQSTYLNNL